MIQTLRTVSISLALALSFLAVGFAAEKHCAECGMRVDNSSKFSAKITQGSSTLDFCDIGDLFIYMKKKAPQEAKAEVKDQVAGSWIDARKAFFVRDEKKFSTPMGWGIAAFQEKDIALKNGAVFDFDSMAKALK